ncbi:MAG: hypothetical protein WBP81_24180 [Solirubrobacteraceae bacterium]
MPRIVQRGVEMRLGRLGSIEGQHEELVGDAEPTATGERDVRQRRCRRRSVPARASWPHRDDEQS